MLILDTQGTPRGIPLHLNNINKSWLTMSSLINGYLGHLLQEVKILLVNLCHYYVIMFGANYYSDLAF